MVDSNNLDSVLLNTSERITDRIIKAKALKRHPELKTSSFRDIFRMGPGAVRARFYLMTPIKDRRVTTSSYVRY